MDTETKKIYDSEYYKKNKHIISAKQKEYRESHKEQIKERNKQSSLCVSKEKRRTYNRRYRKKHPEKMGENQKNFLRKNPDYNSIYLRARRKNPKHRLSHAISAAIYRSLINNKKGRHWEDLVGYTILQLKEHIETQFEEWMTWDNYGEWHIDHKVPISFFSYDTVNDPDFKECWALSNLRPLEKIENIKKGNKVKIDLDKVEKLHKRQIARLLTHLEKTGQLTVELEKDLKRAYRFAFEDVETLIQGLDKENTDGKAQKTRS